MGTADADKIYVILECIRQLQDIKTYLELMEEMVKMSFWKFKKKAIVQKNEVDFLLSKMYTYDIPHFYIIWKIL